MDPVPDKKSCPPCASTKGDNAYYLPVCEFVARSPAYASCLFKIAENQAGRSSQHPSHRECCAPIESGRCRALSMRQEEDLQGVALYYVPRQAMASMPISSQPRFYDAAPPAAPAPMILPAPLDESGNGYAAAINAALQESIPLATSAATVTPKADPVSPVKPVSRPPTNRPAMMPGETPLQYARRCAGTNPP